MKKRKAKMWMQNLGGRLAAFLPDWCCGRRLVLEQKYRSIYGSKDWRERSDGERRRTACLYLIVFSMFLPLLVWSGFSEVRGWGKSDVEQLLRPDYGQESQTEQLEAELRYGERFLRKDVGIALEPRTLTKEQQKKHLKKTAAFLEKKILGNNAALSSVEEDLYLPEFEGGVQIQWDSDSPEVLDEKGKLYLLAAEEGQKVKLTAVLTLNEMTERKEIPIIIHLPEEESVWQKALLRELEEALESAKGGDCTEDGLLLPKKTKNGVLIDWKRNRGGVFFPLLGLMLLALAVIYSRRYRRIDRRLAAIRASIQRDLPELINKLILLLSAGLGIDASIKKITEDYGTFCGNSRRISYLYDALAEVQTRVSQSNVLLSKELFEMARKSEVQEFMRFASIVGDNIQKGNALSEKLETEAAMLWQARKKRAESRGRVAETKLTLPLAVLLSVLVVITVAPTLM